MDLSKLTQEQINTLKSIAIQVNTSLESLLAEHSNIEALLESYNNQQFGILNE